MTEADEQTPRLVRHAGLALGLIAFLLLLLLDTPLRHDPTFGDRPARAAAVTALMALWWLTEALPIYVTACVPLLLFPLLGVFEQRGVAALWPTFKPYVDGYIFLFMGGMCIAAAMQQCGLHRRIALAIMHAIGTDPRRLLLGMICGTAFISLWISNTATAAMMLPIGLAILAQSETHGGGKRLRHYGAALMLSIAYASNVGGIGTKIGTAPNGQFAQFMAAHHVEVSFFQFMAVGLPFVVLMLPIVWLVLWRVGRKDAPPREVGEAAVEGERAKLGRTKPAEKAVLAVFVLTIAAWIAAKPVAEALKPVAQDRFGFALTSGDVEGAIAMLATLALMLSRVRGRATLEPRSLKTIPWETLLLLGGSFSMAEGVKESGLSAWLGAQLHALADLAPFTQTLLASVATVAISAVASNTATISVMLNVLAGAVTPAYSSTVLFTATIASSCDFALPAGTPPNAIVFGSGYLTVPRMAKTGALLDVIAAVVAAAWCFVSVRFVL